MKLDATLLKGLVLSLDMTGTRSENKNTSYFTIDAAYNFSPVEVLRFTDGRLASVNSSNPLIAVDGSGGYVRNKMNMNTITATLKYDVPWVKGLSAYLRATFDNNNSVQKTFSSPVTLYTYDKQTGEIKEDDKTTYPKAKITLKETDRFVDNKLVELGANYNRTFAAKHDVSGLLVINYQDYHNRYLTGENLDMAGIYPEIMGSATTPKVNGEESYSERASMIGRATYGYDNRYLVDFSVRSDGSSVYGSSKRWGTFGSVGVAWNLHHEKWLAENPYVNELKIRGSWGTTGGQNFYPFQAMMMYSYKESAIDGLTYDDYIGALLKAFGNPDLKWQQTEKLNVGVDFTLLNSRLSGYFNIYKDVSKSVLIDVLLAPSVGFASYKDNLGEIENKGLELNLRGVLLKDADRRMQWDVFFNIVKNKNRLMKLNDALAAYNKSQDDEMNGEIEEGKTRAPMVRYQEGKSINMIWANESIGIDPNTGEEVFIALNGDKVNKWSTDNYKPLGCSDPKFEGNFGTMFMYKGFQLNAYFRYSYGADVYNQTLVDKVENVDPKENADRRVLYDRWKTPGDVAKFKAISNTEATMPTSRFIEQENYITLSSLNLSYQFDAGRLRHYGIERLKLSLIGNDVFRASTVKMERGTSYPFARNYSVALQVTF